MNRGATCSRCPGAAAAEIDGEPLCEPCATNVVRHDSFAEMVSARYPRLAAQYGYGSAR